MSSFQDFSLVKNEVSFVKDNNDLDSESISFIFMVLDRLYGGVDLDEYIIDGPSDFCIDAYYINDSEKEINIFQFKYTTKFDKAAKKDGLKDADVSDFISKLEKVWNRDETITAEANLKTREAIKNIWEAIEKGYTNTKIWFISNNFKTISKVTKIEQIEKDVAKKFKAKLKLLSLSDVVNLSVESEFESVDLKLQLKARNYFEDSAGDVRALIGEIDASNLLKGVLNESDELNENVFNENVRLYLRKHTKINKQIYASIESEDNYKFFFYNNGLTAVCDSFEHSNSDGPIVNLKNFQIVNGSQTVHSIYEAYKNGLSENLKKIYLLLRIYEVKNRRIGQDIARYTNTQNPVKSRDILSNDEVQIKLQKELLTQGYLYERKRYEHREEKDNKKKIDAEKLGQILLAFYGDKPGSAKNKKEEIFGDYYGDIFSDNTISADYVLLPFQISQSLESSIKKFSKEIKLISDIPTVHKMLEEDGYLNYSLYYLLFTVKMLAEKDGLELTVANKDEILKYSEKAKEVVKKLTKKRLTETSVSLPYIFKSNDFTADIRKEIDDDKKTGKGKTDTKLAETDTQV